MQADLIMQLAQAYAASTVHSGQPQRQEGPSFQELMARRSTPSSSQQCKAENPPADQPPQPDDPLAQLLAAALVAQPPALTTDAMPAAHSAIVSAAAPAFAADGQSHALSHAGLLPSDAQTSAPQPVAAQVLPAQPAAQQMQAQTGQFQQVHTPEQSPQTASAAAEQAAPSLPNGQATAEQIQQNAVPQELEVLDAQHGAPQQLLFRDVAHTPVKVADAPVLDAESSQLDANLTSQIDLALEKGEKTLQLKLTPDHLGAVLVELTQTADGALRVVLSATTEKAAALLSDHAAGLGGLLRNTAQGPVQIQVYHTEQEPQNQQNQQNPDSHHGRQHSQQQQNQQHHHSAQDFIQQLRLGILPVETEAS